MARLLSILKTLFSSVIGLVASLIGFVIGGAYLFIYLESPLETSDRMVSNLGTDLYDYSLHCM